ncbi:MAG: metallophosphoesterase [Oscillospiraceae bacterium]|nr:metallophosphoesterase [Oscillospiraceae bacterium]
MIKLLHAADLHLDSPLVSAGDPAARRAELRQTARRVFDLAKQEQADIILLAGDLFDNSSPFLDTVELIKSLQKRRECLFSLPPATTIAAAAAAHTLIVTGAKMCIFSKSPRLKR